VKIKPDPALIGAFVFGALALSAGALFFFGGRNPLARQKRIVVFFDRSISGLDRGAPVKLRGVRAGRIIGIRALLGPDHRPLVEVLCDVAQGGLLGPDDQPIDLSRPERVKELVDQGMRARLEPAGLSGEYLLELDFFDAKLYPVRPPPALESATRYPVVPSIASSTEEFVDGVQSALRELRGADVGGVTRTFSGPEFKRTLQQIGDAAASVKNLADYLERNPNAIISGKKEAKK
jgi:paraquat-inducible protein B